MKIETRELMQALEALDPMQNCCVDSVTILLINGSSIDSGDITVEKNTLVYARDPLDIDKQSIIPMDHIISISARLNRAECLKQKVEPLIGAVIEWFNRRGG